MTDPTNTPSAYRRAVSYIDKSREYYGAHGYETPYRWAQYDTVPFVHPSEINKPLREMKIGVVTTAFPTDFVRPKRSYAMACDPVPDSMFTDDLSWDKNATHTKDVASFLPLTTLQSFVGSKIGSVSERFYGVPTEYSQRRTHVDADAVLGWCQEDGVDAVLLVAL